MFKIKMFIKRILQKYFMSIFFINKFKNKNDKRTIWFIGSADYKNIGDLAIAEATSKFLKDNFNHYNVNEITLGEYYKYWLSMKKYLKKQDIIILQGGGNLGVDYFDAERNRRDVIKNYPNNKIIIFPCTIDYSNTKKGIKELNKSIKLYNLHSDLTIIPREEKSYKQMLNIYEKCNIILLPDIVLYYSEYKINKKRNGIILAIRKDNEGTQIPFINNEFETKYNIRYSDNLADLDIIRPNQRAIIINKKMEELAECKLVITNRLHITIFCAITNTPCIFINNTNKKIEGVYKLWMKDFNYIKKYDKTKTIDEQINQLLNEKYNKYQKYDFKEIIDIIEKSEK